MQKNRQPKIITALLALRYDSQTYLKKRKIQKLFKKCIFLNSKIPRIVLLLLLFFFPFQIDFNTLKNWEYISLRVDRRFDRWHVEECNVHAATGAMIERGCERRGEKWAERDEERAKNTARGVWQCDKRDAENSNGVGSPVYS